MRACTGLPQRGRRSTWVPSLLALLLAACAGPASAPTAEDALPAAGSLPPAAEDCDAWQARLRDSAMTYVESGGDESAVPTGALADWVAGRASPPLAKRLEQRGAEQLRRTFLADVLGHGIQQRLGPPRVVPDDAAPDRMLAYVPVQDTKLLDNEVGDFPVMTDVLLLEYARVDGGWQLDALPQYLPFVFRGRLPEAEHAVRLREPVRTSPVLYLRHFAPGEVPDEVRDVYAEEGIATDIGRAWEDLTWRDNIVAYPLRDPKGRTDPIVRGRPDTYWKLQEIAQDEWLPAFSYDYDTARGLELPSDSVTLRAHPEVSAELLADVLRVFARRSVYLRHVRIEVHAHPDDLVPSYLHLRQPMSWEEQQSLPVVAAGLDLDALRARLGTPLPTRAGVDPATAGTVQDVVTALDRLRALGVTELFVAVLPEGYDPFQ